MLQDDGEIREGSLWFRFKEELPHPPIFFPSPPLLSFSIPPPPSFYSLLQQSNEVRLHWEMI
jgi:hypothetical protein